MPDEGIVEWKVYAQTLPPLGNLPRRHSRCPLNLQRCSQPRSQGLFPGLGGGAGKGPGIGWSRAHLTPWNPGCNKLVSLHNQKCQNHNGGETVWAFRLRSAFKRWNFASFCSVIATSSDVLNIYWKAKTLLPFYRLVWQISAVSASTRFLACQGGQ